MTTAATFTIDVVSDVVCPWCYIGKRKLEAALELAQAAGLPAPEVRWHPFQLNPDLPIEGISRKQYVEEKFGGAQRAAEKYAHIKTAGQSVGLDLNFEGIQKQPNTLAAHALLAYAHQQGLAAGNDVKERLLKANFVDNQFLGDIEVLVQIATDAGLDGDAARAFVTDAQQLQVVAEADQRVRDMGIGGVPFFIFNQKVAVSGAQNPSDLLAAMQQSLQA
jgi:predicted DsbA family dithiol-disulfide isomerase